MPRYHVIYSRATTNIKNLLFSNFPEITWLYRMEKMIYAHVQLSAVLTPSYIICYSKYDKLFKSQGPAYTKHTMLIRLR